MARAVLAAPPRPARLAVASGDRLVATAVAASFVMMPLAYPKLGGFVTPADAALGAAVGVSLLWLGANLHRIRFPLVVPMGLIVCAGALAGMLGDHPHIALIAVVQDLALYGWFLAIANVCRTAELLKIVIRTWIWSSVAWAALLVVATVANWSALAGQEVEGGRAAFTFDTPNQAGAFFAVSLLLVFAARFPRRGIASILAVGILITALMLTSSNAALGGTIAAALVVAVIRVGRGSTGVVGAIVAAGVVITLVCAAVFVFVRLDVTGAATRSEFPLVKNSLGRADRSTEGRLSIVNTLQDLYFAGDLIGVGAAATKQMLIDGGDLDAKSAHNDLLAMLVERGVIGTAGFFLLVAALAFVAASIVRVLDPPFSAVVPEPSFLLGGLVVIMLVSLTHEVLHFRFVWALIGVIVALHLWGRPGGVRTWSPQDRLVGAPGP